MFRAAIVASLALAPSAGLSEAQNAGRPFCASSEALARLLENQFGETVFGAGLQGDHGLVTLYVSPETGSWTIVISRPDGRACAVAAGQAWQDNPDHVMGTPS